MYLLGFMFEGRPILRAEDAETLCTYQSIESAVETLVPEDNGVSKEMAFATQKALIFLLIFKPFVIEFNGTLDEINYYLEPREEGEDNFVLQIRGEFCFNAAFISKEFLENKEVTSVVGRAKDEIEKIVDSHTAELKLQEVLGADLLKDLSKPTWRERVNNIANGLWKWLKTH